MLVTAITASACLVDAAGCLAHRGRRAGQDGVSSGPRRRPSRFVPWEPPVIRPDGPIRAAASEHRGRPVGCMPPYEGMEPDGI